MSVIRSVILYATPIWATAIATPSYSITCCAFRTVSDDVALVIASMVPLEDLVAKAVERSAHEPIRRNDIRANTMAKKLEQLN
ncbi:hypothetical protein AWZ03_015411 [Drosophila navojoa]|uniref:Uncharacterized protein n=1 Tax=Drosophila navojoa TaxID=7232 RepID=A0A484AL89_DRONA|nr:hypothetical protein AWZ03_015411 [Drosophila navojoa]